MFYLVSEIRVRENDESCDPSTDGLRQAFG